jgi:hypothetical protein
MSEKVYDFTKVRPEKCKRSLYKGKKAYIFMKGMGFFLMFIN